jgi:hypothetical protein
MGSEGIKGQAISALLDEAQVFVFWGTGRLATKAFEWVVPRVAASQLGTYIAGLYERYLAGYAARLGTAFEKLKLARSGLLGKAMIAHDAMKATEAAIAERVSMSLKAMRARGQVGQLAAAVLERVGGVAGNAWGKKWYIGRTQALQLFAEARDRKIPLFDSTPIVVGKRLKSDEDLVHNMLYMTVETVLQSGIAAGEGSRTRRFAIAGAISFVDSNVMNLYVKHDLDFGRNVRDTGWEVIVGSTQTIIDIDALEYFENMAIRTSNSKLRLVGIAIGMADQYLGYIAYGKMTQKYQAQEKAKPETRLFPIFAPQGS